ncbi:S26 family signal peptidase [Reyranella sp.]|uniref:S26 family signal peptidase n=1 Tax=Reyranella sp. TaxID=1929291 RepID=UPI0027201167|nr:S26 family signal peptidase [Reyranella sp.]MDO8972407.1 S26 family signal peptidase [Reyranella sp.]
MNGRKRVLVAMLAGVVILAVSAGKGALPLFMWNASASVPVGLYRLQSIDKLYAAELVVVVPPEPLASFLVEGNYLPRGVPMLKHVLALPGQTVCRRGLAILIDAKLVGLARERDGRGRPLPSWQGCRVVAADELFLMNWQSADSLDGRYFGPTPTSAVVAYARPVWIEKE